MRGAPSRSITRDTQHERRQSTSQSRHEDNHQGEQAMNEDENYLVIGGRLYLDERGFVQRNGKLYAKWLANHDREVAAKAW